jgi:Uma2 family endonuclease
MVTHPVARARIMARVSLLLSSASRAYRMHMPAVTRPPRRRERNPRPWTRAELARFPDDGNRYEVLDGELLVTPQANPPHQRIALVLAFRLEAYCSRLGLAIVVAPGAVPHGDSELQPDVQVIPCKPADARKGWERVPRPLLVVEVLSEGSRRYDSGIKRSAYLRWRITDYWIIDPETRTITVARRGHDDVVRLDIVRWHPAGAAEPLELDIAELFRAAIGD